MLSAHELYLFKTLTELNAVSGNEKQVRDYLKNVYTNLGYELITSDLGVVIAHKKSRKANAPKVYIDGHMDEVGFIVGNLLDDGTVKLIPIGGLSIKDVLDTSYRLTTSTGKEYIGFIKNKDDENITIDDLILEIGFMSKKELLDNDVNFGDMVTFVSDFVDEGDDLYSGKCIDNRYGIVLGLEVLEYFKDKELPFDLYVGGSLQEEVGLRSAKSIVNLLKPDLVIVLDCSRAKDEPSELGHIGEGLLIRFYDRVMIANKALLDLQINAAKKRNVPYQYFTTLGGTNAGSFHVEGSGTFTLNHCICAKSIHTPRAYMRGIDYVAARESLLEILENFDEKTLEMLRKSF